MKNIYHGDARYEKIAYQMQMLSIEDVTTKRQMLNGTIVWRLPIKNNNSGKTNIEVAAFSTGYVRNQNSCYSNYQLNKTKKEKRYVEMKDYDTGRPVIKTFEDTVRVLIPIEIDRLEYMMKYCIKNYFINRANEVPDSKYVPKWKYDDHVAKAYSGGCMETPEVKVIVNGHRYNVI